MVQLLSWSYRHNSFNSRCSIIAEQDRIQVCIQVEFDSKSNSISGILYGAVHHRIDEVTLIGVDFAEQIVEPDYHSANLTRILRA